MVERGGSNSERRRGRPRRPNIELERKIKTPAPEVVKSEPKNENGDCVHHWMLGPDIAGTASGTCSICGASRTFTNDLIPSWSKNTKRKEPEIEF